MMIRIPRTGALPRLAFLVGSVLFASTPSEVQAQSDPSCTDFGGALRFDGVLDQARSNADFTLNTMTLEAWVYVTHGSHGWGGLAAWGRDGEAAWEVAINVNGSLSFQTNWGKPEQQRVDSEQSVGANGWHHVAVSFDGQRARLYLDGQPDRVKTWAHPIVPGSQWYWMGLGMNFPGGDEFLGVTVDELRIWDRARSLEEIRATLGAPLRGTEAGLFAYYDFDGGGADAIVDRSGQGRDAFRGRYPGVIEEEEPDWTFSDAPFQDSVVYCNSELTSGGCLPAIAQTGTASMGGNDPFRVDVAGAESWDFGVLVYGYAPTQLNVVDGVLCIAPPFQRLHPVLAEPQGVGGCEGLFSYDLQPLLASGTDAWILPGERLYFQLWYVNHPGGPGVVRWSDALATTVCP